MGSVVRSAMLSWMLDPERKMEVAELCALMLGSMSQHGDKSTDPRCRIPTPFDEDIIKDGALSEPVCCCVNRMHDCMNKYHNETLLHATFYTMRAAALLPGERLTSIRARKVFLACLSVAVKYSSAKVSESVMAIAYLNDMTEKEVARIERELLSLLDYRLELSAEALLDTSVAMQRILNEEHVRFRTALMCPACHMRSLASCSQVGCRRTAHVPERRG